MVALLSLATAVPPHRVAQADAKRTAARLFEDEPGEASRLLSVFDNAGIAWRHFCLPPEAYLEPRGFAERNRLASEGALDLLEAAARSACEQAGIAPERVDSIVTVCSTGIATPSLDAPLAERLGLRGDVERTPLFGLGCAGGVSGLARAAALARGNPGSIVLVTVVELCSLTLRKADRSKANLVACALFADGAAAALLSSEGDGPRLAGSGEHRWPETLDVMGWRVEDDGLGVLFSISIPEIARTRMRAATDRFLAGRGLARGDVDRWIAHPGGAKVVAGLAEAWDVPAAELEDSRAVLEAYGNMSAATVLFVLERALAAPGWRRGLLSGMGPGFTATFALIERGAAT